MGKSARLYRFSTEAPELLELDELLELEELEELEELLELEEELLEDEFESGGLLPEPPPQAPRTKTNNKGKKRK